MGSLPRPWGRCCTHHDRCPMVVTSGEGLPFLLVVTELLSHSPRGRKSECQGQLYSISAAGCDLAYK